MSRENFATGLIFGRLGPWQRGSSNAFPEIRISKSTLDHTHLHYPTGPYFKPPSQYTLMTTMASSENLLTHDEIWDDSALVNAWDEALQEYKVRYHFHGSALP